MTNSELDILNEQLRLDDNALIQRYSTIKKIKLEKEKQLNRRLELKDENNYLGLVIDRLAYGFAKEELDIVFSEIKKRGIITI